MNSFGAKFKRLIVWLGTNLLFSEVISYADKLIDFLVIETFKPLINSTKKFLFFYFKMLTNNKNKFSLTQQSTIYITNID